MLRQMEEEMRRIRVQDLLAQSVVSILNLSYRRIAKEDERDLEQAKLGIDAIRALVDMLEPEAQHEVKNALSQIQTRATPRWPDRVAAGGGAPPRTRGRRRPARSRRKSSPAASASRRSGLWTPGSG